MKLQIKTHTQKVLILEVKNKYDPFPTSAAYITYTDKFQVQDQSASFEETEASRKLPQTCKQRMLQRGCC